MVTIEDDADVGGEPDDDGAADRDAWSRPASTPLWIMAAVGVAGLVAGGAIQVWSQRVGNGPDAEASQGLLAFLQTVAFGVVFFGALVLALAVSIPLIRRYRDAAATGGPRTDSSDAPEPLVPDDQDG